MIPKFRLDALTDGVFGVAMTLLVIDLRLPESFHPADAGELIHRIAELGNQFLVYVVSFYVVALRWISMVRLAPRGEEVSATFTKWAMVHLLLITLVPFTTMLIGRYPTLAPAVWIYAGHTIVVAVIALRLVALAEHDPSHRQVLEDRVGLSMLILASVLAIGVSLFAPKWAMLLYLINMLDGPARWWLLRRR